MLLGILYSLTLLAASPEALSVQRYSADSVNATLYVLPVAQSVVPHIVILDDDSLALYPANSSKFLFKHTIPDDTLMFDLVDTNNDQMPELFILTPNTFHHHFKEGDGVMTESFSIEPALPWKVDQPFLHPLIVPYMDTHHAAIPQLNAIVLKTLSGEEVATFPKVLSNTDALFSFPIYPNQIASPGAFEFRVDALLTTPIEVPQALESKTLRESNEALSPRKLRDSEKLDFEFWPQFPLSSAPDSIRTVLFASHAPEHVNTIIRMKQPVQRSVPNATEPFTISPGRMYPGTIALPESGLPDFNQDGYHDLVLWSIPLPGGSTAALINSLRSQQWALYVSVHLFNPEKGLYEAKPKTRLKTNIALQYLFTRQHQAPLHNLSFADLNNDGASDLVFSPTPNEIEVWLYEDGFSASPQYKNTFDRPVSLIAVPKQDSLNQSHSILLRDSFSIYRLSIPVAK